MGNLSLSEMLGVEEGIVFKLIGLKGHYPEELYMILDNQLFSLNNLSETVTLSEIFTSEYESSILVSIPLDGNNNIDCCDDVCKIGFKPNSDEDDETDDNTEECCDCKECICNEDKCEDNLDHINYIALEYLRLLHKYTDFKYITRDLRDGEVYVHECEPNLEYKNTPDEFWDSYGIIKQILPSELFASLETTHCYKIEQLLT